MLERGNFGRHFSPSTIGPGLKCSEVVLPLILPTWSCKGVCPYPLPAAHGSCSGLQCHVLQLPQREGWKLPLASQGSLSSWWGGCLARGPPSSSSAQTLQPPSSYRLSLINHISGLSALLIVVEVCFKTYFTKYSCYFEFLLSNLMLPIDYLY